MTKTVLFFIQGVTITLSLLMLVFGIIFIVNAFRSEGEVAFGSLVFGILLFLTGGGLLVSSVGELIKKVVNNK